MSNLIHLRNRVLNQPLLLESGYAKVLTGALQGRFGIKGLADKDSTMSAEDLANEAQMFMDSKSRVEAKPYNVVGSSAIVPVIGSLVNKTGYLRPYSGMTGYDTVRANIDIALADDNVDHIVLHIDSGGGEVSGCFDLCDYIKSKLDDIKITALVDDIACSAAYAIASSCSEVLISETSTIGSVGVITIHANYEKAIEEQGVEVTIITAGRNKADMNPYEKLPEEVLSRVQGKLNAIWEMFASRVAMSRNLDIEKVYSMEALTYMGQSGIEIGLADRVVSVNDYLQSLLSPSGSINSTTSLESQDMTIENEQVSENVEANASAASVEAENTIASAEAIANAKAEGEAESRTRIKTILSSEEAEGRKTQAEHLAFNTSMSAEEAVALLAVSAKEVAQPKEEASVGADFKAAMSEQTAEEIGMDAEASDDPNDPVAFACQAYNSLN